MPKEINWKQQIQNFLAKYPELRHKVDTVQLERDILKLVNTYKPLVDSFIGLFQVEVDIANACTFVIFAKSRGFSDTNMTTVFRHVAGIGTAGSRQFVGSVGAKLLKIDKLMNEIGPASKAFAVVGLGIQIIIHCRRGAYGAAYGELVKTIVSLGCPPAALLDLVFSLVELFAPRFVQSPFFRILKSINPATNMQMIGDTLFVLASIWSYAMENTDPAVEKKLADLADRWEANALGVFTQGSRDFVELLDEIVGFNWDWVRNLVEYNKNNRSQSFLRY